MTSQASRSLPILSRLCTKRDDTEVTKPMSAAFRAASSASSCRVTALENAAAMRQLVDEGQDPDIAILDIAMPGEDGLSLARFLRASTAARIIMVTASGETVDRIIGIEMGADDYLPKPVDLRELLARVKAVCRRRTKFAKVEEPDDPEHKVIAFGRCRLHLDAHLLLIEFLK